MADKTYVLRDLPGVAALEGEARRWVADKNREWSKEFDGLDDRIGLVCQRLFGLTSEDARRVVQEDDEPDQDFWDRCDAHREHFEFMLDSDDPEVIAWFDANGWDVRGADGECLNCLYWVAWPLILAIKGVRGRLPGQAPSDAEVAANAEAFEAKMQREAEEFRRQRRAR